MDMASAVLCPRGSFKLSGVSDFSFIWDSGYLTQFRSKNLLQVNNVFRRKSGNKPSFKAFAKAVNCCPRRTMSKFCTRILMSSFQLEIQFFPAVIAFSCNGALHMIFTISNVFRTDPSRNSGLHLTQMFYQIPGGQNFKAFLCLQYYNCQRCSLTAKCNLHCHES